MIMIKNPVHREQKAVDRCARPGFLLPTASCKLPTDRRGFATLFAMLVAGLLLSVGLVIYDITSKELIFSSITRDSNFAFYAADAGLECALYWDIKYTGSANFSSGSVFATSTDSQPPSSNVICNGIDIAAEPWTIVTAPTAATTTFTLTFAPQPYCVRVWTEKWKNTLGSVSTRVTARGYNNGCDTGAPNRIERALVSSY